MMCALLAAMPTPTPSRPHAPAAAAPAADAFKFELDRPGWAPDWLDPGMLEALRSDLEARALLEAEYTVGGWSLGVLSQGRW